MSKYIRGADWLRFVKKEVDVINMEKFRWSVERGSGALQPVWFKEIFFQSLITFFNKL